MVIYGLLATKIRSKEQKMYPTGIIDDNYSKKRAENVSNRVYWQQKSDKKGRKCIQ